MNGQPPTGPWRPPNRRTTARSGRDADDEYAPIGSLTAIGDGRAWDQVRFSDFPSKAAFMAVVADADRLAHQAAHRESAIADTYTMILRPVIDRLRESVEA